MRHHGHTLLAMITDGGGIPMVLMNELGVDLGRLREDLLAALDAPDGMRRAYLRQRIASEQERALRRSAGG